MSLERIFNEDEHEYHLHSQTGECMSSHMLQLFSKSPYRYISKIGNNRFEDKPEYAFGRAAHKIILEGIEEFDKAYTVSDGPINEKTGIPYGKTTKAYTEWLSMQDGEVITVNDFGIMYEMMRSVWTNHIAYRLLEKGRPESVCREMYCGVKCQIRMDWFSEEYGIVDLKTCRDIEFFDKDCRDFGYAYQLAFYQKVLEIATGTLYPVHIIAVDKTDEHICGVWNIPNVELARCSIVNEASLSRYRKCLETDKWPTGYENERIFALEKI